MLVCSDAGCKGLKRAYLTVGSRKLATFGWNHQVFSWVAENILRKAHSRYEKVACANLSITNTHASSASFKA